MIAVLRNNRDLWAGVMLVGIGAGAVLMARDYPFGTTLRMGAGYFPSVLGWILIAFGCWIGVSGLRHRAVIEGGWSPRALLVLPLSLVLFGVFIDRAGFVPALAVLIFGAAAAGRDFRLVEVLALTAFLTALCVLIFVVGLGLPYPLVFGF
ncbi:MAG: tripartite tricarboxylate transporter TctB family protein [Proteobacteria bacterium]|nr:tripartite tricarboxylate transporter TctB family protein [Pseudomonadota bacterium]